jgi:hypothetical protein
LDVDGVSVVAYVPGYGIDPVRPLESLTGFIAQAALPRGSPTSALLGLERAPSVVPEGWTPQTLDEARATFEARVGRPPSPDEVF